jgi:hypothetical protein
MMWTGWSAARAAGHALWPQHHRRRDQVCDQKLADKPSLNLRGTYGSYDQADGVITASTPVTKDGLVRIGGSFARLTRAVSARTSPPGRTITTRT